MRCILSGDGGAWIKAGAEYIEKGVPVLDKFHMMKYINKAANQMLDEEGQPKDGCGEALYKGKKKKFVKTIKAIRKCAPNEKAVNDCEEYLLNNWDSAGEEWWWIRMSKWMRAEGHVELYG